MTERICWPCSRRILGDLLADDSIVLTMDTTAGGRAELGFFGYVNFIVAAELSSA